MRRVLLSVVVVLAIVGSGIFYRRHLEQVPPAASVVNVESVSVQPVRVAPMVERVASYGNLVSDRSVNIVPQSAGTIRQILFKDGQTVDSGAPLVVMDSGIAEAQLQSSRAQADADLQNLRRTQSLTRQGLDSTYSLEQAQSRAAASQADVRINERRLGQLTLRAPFAGTLGSSRVDIGAFVTSADNIVQLQDLTVLQIEFRLPSAVAMRVTPSMPVFVQVPGNDQATDVQGRLSFIDPAISTDTRSVLMRALVSNTKLLRAGLYVRVSIELGTHPEALVVPMGAVTTDLNGSYVYVVDDKNIAHQRTVTLGLSDGDDLELVSGVKRGDVIVTVGQFRLRDGDAVRIVPVSTAAKSAS